MRYLIVLCLSLCVGCTTLESAAKAGASIALDGIGAALEEKMGAMGGELIRVAKEAADKGIEAGADYASEKTIRAANLGIRKTIVSAGLNPGKYDLNDDGEYSDEELEMIAADLKGVEGWTGTLALMAFYVLAQLLKWAKRNGVAGKMLSILSKEDKP